MWHLPQRGTPLRDKIAVMMVEDWRERLLAACDAANTAGMSDYVIAKKAGLGRNFVQQLRTSPRSPAATNVILLCKALNISLAHIFLGSDITPEGERLVLAFQALPEDMREAVLKLVLTPRSQPGS
jgi:transcriptional regulator with XRE-family HTH domain